MTIPSNINLPGAYLSISNVRAVTGLSAPDFESVFMAQKLSSGTANAGEYLQVFSKSDAETKFGIGSQIAEMLGLYFLNNSLNPVFAVGLDDAVASAAAEFKIVTTGTSTAPGTLSMMINGKSISIGISTGDTPAIVSAAIIAAITADPTLPVTATLSVLDVILTAKNKGTVANSIDVRFNYYEFESFPLGISSVAVSVETVGATDPDIDDALSAIPDEVISLFVHPYADNVNIGKVKLEIARRFGPLVQLEGHSIVSKKGTVSEVGNFTEQFNDQFLTVLDAGNGRPTPDYLQTGALAGVMAGSLGDDPGRPLQTLELAGVLPEVKANRRLKNERNSLIDSGCSAIGVEKSGAVVILRMVTTFLTTQGARDKSYQNTNTMFISSYLRQTLLATIKLTYPRHKLGNDGTRYDVGQVVATPKMITGTILGWYTKLEALALVENYKQFKTELIVVRDGNNPDRVNSILPTDYINQFRIFAGEIQFVL